MLFAVWRALRRGLSSSSLFYPLRHAIPGDESGTLQRLREHRKMRFDPALARNHGRLVKLTGDGALVEFASAVDALGAAIEFQQAMVEANRDQTTESALVFRMGVHAGDLIVDGDDLYGDGVNVAARLEIVIAAGLDSN
jgi:class 3 adenylate cyclase